MEVVVGLLLLLLLGGTVSPGDVARAVERSIRAALPSARDVDVELRVASRGRLLAGDLDELVIRVDGFDLAELGRLRLVLSRGRPTREGHIRRLVVEATNGRVPIAPSSSPTESSAGQQVLDVAAVRLELDDLTFDTAKIGSGPTSFAIHHVGSTRATVQLSGAALNAGIAPRIRSLREVTVLLEEPDRVQVRGVLDAVIPIPVELTGRITVASDTQVVLTQARASVMGVALPDSLVRGLVGGANPLVDLRQWAGLPVGLRLKQVGVRESAIVGEGEVRLRRERIRSESRP